MRKTSALLFAPALALGMAALGAAAPASAATNEWSWQADLGQVNDSGATGSAMVTVKGTQLTVDIRASGLAKTFSDAPYPHVGHIHIDGGKGCPPADADKNDDGVVSVPEGAPYYGTIGTTLSSSGDTSANSALDVKRAVGQGSSIDYHRTFTVNQDTLASLKKGTAEVVVHGLDPATLSKKAQGEDSSPLTKDLPLAATAPALCGALHASQMTMPNGAAATGGGAAAQGPQAGLLALGGSMILAAGAASVVIRRRTALARAGR